MELIDTIGDMISTDYKKRFIAEYNQIEIRINKLKNIIDGYYNKQLDFELSAPISIYECQLDGMQFYRNFLVLRAGFEDITLD